MRISISGSNTSAQRALGQWSSALGHGPILGGEITQCILVVTPLAYCACDWSIFPLETLLQEYSQAAVKLPSLDRSAVTKRLVTTALMYIFQTLIIDIKDCLGHPQRSQLCLASEKLELSFWTTSNFLWIDSANPGALFITHFVKCSVTVWFKSADWFAQELGKDEPRAVNICC